MWSKLFGMHKLHKISNITLLGLLLSMRIVLQLVGSFSIGPTTISFTWITLIITGFIFGPFIGFLFGAIADTLGFLMSSSPYLWEYSIQEPLIGLVAGVIGFIYFNYKSNKWIDFIIFEVLLTAFTMTAIIITLQEHPDFNKAIGHSTRTSSKSFMNNKIIPLVLVPIFYVVINILIGFLILKDKKNYRIFLYISIIVIQAWIIWSWIEGPWAQIRYWKRYKMWPKLNDQNAVSITMRWLFNIRVFKATLVVPLEILIGSSLIIVYKHLPSNQNGW